MSRLLPMCLIALFLLSSSIVSGASPTNSGLSGGAAWPRGEVRVLSYLGPVLNPLVVESFRQWQDLGTRNARFSVHLYEEAPCDALENLRKPRQIVLCTISDVSVWGQTRYTTKRHQMVSAYIEIRVAETLDWNRATICHEIGHAITGMPDSYGSKPDQSCVHGSLTYPGEFDARYTHYVYHKYGGRQRR